MGDFICNLKDFRLKKGYTQDDLSKIVKVRRETIGRLEAGLYNPSLKLALTIAKAVDANIEELFIFKDLN